MKFQKGELEEAVVIAIFATTTQNGAIDGKTQAKLTIYYKFGCNYFCVIFRLTKTRKLANFFSEKINLGLHFRLTKISFNEIFLHRQIFL